VALWSISNALHVPLDTNIEELPEVPYTISYVLRKRIQIDNLNELPKDKRPTPDIIWSNRSEDLDEWLDRVLEGKEKKVAEFIIDERDME
jgi:hypothetical protein